MLLQTHEFEIGLSSLGRCVYALSAGCFVAMAQLVPHDCDLLAASDHWAQIRWPLACQDCVHLSSLSVCCAEWLFLCTCKLERAIHALMDM